MAVPRARPDRTGRDAIVAAAAACTAEPISAPELAVLRGMAAFAVPTDGGTDAPLDGLDRLCEIFFAHLEAARHAGAGEGRAS